MSRRYSNLQPRSHTNTILQHYNHIAHTGKEKQEADYKKWLESHTVEEISIANKARSSLRRRLKDNKSAVKRWGAIKDEREVKGPVTSYIHFVSSRFATGDMKDIKLSEASKLIAEEWKALSEGEKKVGARALSPVINVMLSCLLTGFAEVQRSLRRRQEQVRGRIYRNSRPRAYAGTSRCRPFRLILLRPRSFSCERPLRAITA